MSLSPVRPDSLRGSIKHSSHYKSFYYKTKDITNKSDLFGILCQKQSFNRETLQNKLHFWMHTLGRFIATTD